jgi:hypothetical protein
LPLLDLFGAAQLPRLGPTIGSGARRFEEDLLYAITTQDNDNEPDLVAVLQQAIR